MRPWHLAVLSVLCLVGTTVGVGGLILLIRASSRRG